MARCALMALSPGAYEARFRLRGIEPYKPLEPCSGVDYRNQVDNPQSFNLNKVARVNHAFRLERASEKALARVKPEEQAAYTERWWKMRYEKRISDEPISARKERMAALMSKYGVALAELKPLDLDTASQGAYEPLEISQTASLEQEAPRGLNPADFGELEAPSVKMGWQELEDESTMRLAPVKVWVAEERAVPLPKRYTPTIEVGNPEIQTAIDALASLSGYLRSFSGFELIRDIGRADGVQHHLIRKRPEPLGKMSHSAPSSDEEIVSGAGPGRNVAVFDRSEMLAPSEGATIVAQSDGNHVLRIARQVSSAACLDRSRLSVLEIELSRQISRDEAFAEYAAKLLNAYQAQQDQIADDPLHSELIRSLLTSGRVITIDNIRFQPARAAGAAFLNFNLAEGAVVRDVHLDGPATLVRIRGNSAHFENVRFGELSVDLRLSRASWRNCHASAHTKMSGSLGESSFDSACVVPWEASELDMRLADFVGNDLQGRLSGLVVNPEMLPASSRGQLSLSRLSLADMQAFEQQRADAFSRKQIVSIMMTLDPRVSFYRGMPASEGQHVDRGLALRRSRDRISVPSGSPLHALCILFGDRVRGLPPRVLLDTIVQSESQPTRFSADLGNMEAHALDDRAVLLRALDFYYEGAVRLPAVVGTPVSRGPITTSELYRVD
jgi:hypothetical protein